MAAYIRSICTLYLEFTPAEWDAQGGGLAAFLSPACAPGTALYVWTSQTTELREVKSKRAREIVEEVEDDDDYAAGAGGEAEEKKGEEGAAAPARAPRTRTRTIEETVVE